MSDNQLVLTNYKHGVLSFLMQNNRMESVSFCKEHKEGDIGNIYVAKVINIVPNINAAFIYYQPNMRGYLPINPHYTPIMLNRTYDGRILAGDEIIVQMEKEAIRTKDAVFTVNLSLSGKYCVVTNANSKKSVSNKVSKNYKNALQQTIPADTELGIIVRTNAQQLIETTPEYAEILQKEYQMLIDQMYRLIHDGTHRTCYSLLYKAPDAYLTDIRDAYFDEYDSIITDDRQLYDKLSDFLQIYSPKMLSMLSLYKDESYPLRKLYSIDTKIQELLVPRVWLKSGAYLVIEQTEAMYVIDVNSGKNNTNKSNDEYIWQINAEAAREIIRQITLRNLSGIIMVDFINMESQERNERLLDELRHLAHNDRILTTIVDMTPLGLVEITRKKTKKALKEQIN